MQRWAWVCVLLGCSPPAEPPAAESSPVPNAAVQVVASTAPAVDELATAKPAAPEAPKDGLPQALREPTEWTAEAGLGPQGRAESARKRAATVEALYGAAGVAFPPNELLFRVFKREDLLEVWASSSTTQPLVHVTSYRVCAASGDLGPKRREGDFQVPEGFYTLNFFNVQSKYHLSMQVSYPNASDRVLGGPNLGGQIMIHGNCRSVGCLAMTDERIEELWVMAEGLRKSQPHLHVHIFPARDMAQLIESPEAAEHRDFWQNLKEGLDHFERNHRIPNVTITPEGRYTFSSSSP